MVVRLRGSAVFRPWVQSAEQTQAILRRTMRESARYQQDVLRLFAQTQLRLAELWTEAQRSAASAMLPGGNAGSDRQITERSRREATTVRPSRPRR